MIKIPVARPSLPPLDRLMQDLKKIWRSRMLSNFGPYSSEFERRLAALTAARYVSATANGDVGLNLALAALQLPRGSGVVLPSFTFNSDLNAVLWNGLRPVFCDIEPGGFCASAEDAARALGKNTRAILVTHTFGEPCDYDAFEDLSRRKGIPVIYDAAHALGSEHRGRRVGGIGLMETFSFSGTKVFTSGEGGAVMTRSRDISERLKRLRNYGFYGDYVSHYVGMNGKMSEIHAALGVLALDDYDANLRRRARIAADYRARLSGVKQVHVPPIREGCLSTYKDFAIVCRAHRDGLAGALEEQGIQTKKYFRPAHTMPIAKPYVGRDLPHTERAARRVLCLPIFNEMTPEEVATVADAIRAFYRR